MRVIALAGMFLGGLGVLTGLMLTALIAYQVWLRMNAAGSALDAHARDVLASYFDLMNHRARMAVAVSAVGLVVALASIRVLSRNRRGV